MTKSSQSTVHEMMNEHNKAVLIACHRIVRFEEMHSDITTFLPGNPDIWAVESERRANAYWIRRNAMRNYRNGASGIVFVAETAAVAEKIRRIVDRLPGIVRDKTLVVTVDEFTVEFVHNKMERRK